MIAVNINATLTDLLLREVGKRELRFTGVTFGQVGLGLLASVESEKAQPRCQNCGTVMDETICPRCGYQQK